MAHQDGTNKAATGTTPPVTDTTAAGGDGTTGATDQNGTEAPAGTDAAADGWQGEFDAPRAKRTIEHLRSREAELEKRAREAEAKIAEHEREKLSEADRIAADLKAAQEAAAAAREQVALARFEAAAVVAGIPADRITAARAVAGDVVTSDEAGNVSIDTAVFDRLKAEHGYLFAQQAAPPANVSFGAASSQAAGGSGPQLTPDQIEMAQRAGMSLDDYAKYAQRTQR